jgi:hypothetical protein
MPAPSIGHHLSFVNAQSPCHLHGTCRYRLIFVKTPKTAGTTLATFFTDCRVPGAADHCLRMAAYGNASNIAHIAAAWNDYFVFGFSRNPLRRAISQYQYLSTFISPECSDTPSWDAFCADPFVLVSFACVGEDDSNSHLECTRAGELGETGGGGGLRCSAFPRSGDIGTERVLAGLSL